MADKQTKQTEQKLRKYLTGKMGIWKIVAWIAALGALATLSMATVFGKTDTNENAVRFDPLSSSSGEYVYLDVMGISDWMYKYTVNSSTTYFYTAMDKDEDLYIVSMTPSAHAKLREQNNWWNSDDESNPPEAVRLYGGVSTLNSEKITDFAGVWEVSEEQFKNYFGDKYFNEGFSPAGNNRAMYGVFTGILALVWLMAVAIYRTIVGSAKKSIKKLKASGQLEQAAAEFDAPETVQVGLDKVRASANYIFGKGSGTLLRYDDILWIYNMTTNNRGFASSSIVARTADGKAKTVVSTTAGPDAAAILEKTANIILEHNPDVMVGMSKENKKEYKQLVKQNKGK